MPHLVGIVGKPNVGKSTFFSSATLKTVPIASYPFTTIKSNIGVAYVRVQCACKNFGVDDQPVNSACIDGNRFIPIDIIDCAGLVPDAWKGRGLGNQFLDEIRRADSLIHIIDMAGATDIEGRPLPPGSHDPLDDVKFLEKEIDMWIYSMMKRDWDKFARSIESSESNTEKKITERLSGLSIKKDAVSEAIKKAHLIGKKPTTWSESELLTFTSHLRKFSKPIILAANKVDLSPSTDNIGRLREKGYNLIPCCAEAELGLRRAVEKGIIKYLPGDSSFKIINEKVLSAKQKDALRNVRDKIFFKWKSTGVQEVLNRAFFELLDMITVYPVRNPDKLSDHEGRVLPEAYLIPRGTSAKHFAEIIHTDLGEGFIYAIEAKSMMKLGENHVLKDGDVISIVSAKGRG